MILFMVFNYQAKTKVIMCRKKTLTYVMEVKDKNSYVKVTLFMVLNYEEKTKAIMCKCFLFTHESFV